MLSNQKRVEISFKDFLCCRRDQHQPMGGKIHPESSSPKKRKLPEKMFQKSNVSDEKLKKSKGRTKLRFLTKSIAEETKGLQQTKDRSLSKGKKVRRGRILKLDPANCFDYPSEEEELFVKDSRDPSLAQIWKQDLSNIKIYSLEIDFSTQLSRR